MTDSIDLGTLTSAEGYFLLRTSHAERAPYVPDIAHLDLPYRHVFTYARSAQTIKEAALELIGAARRRVFLASYRIGDIDLLNALYKAAERLRGGVYVISDLDEKGLRKGLEAAEDTDDPDAADLRAQNKRFEDLTVRGIYVRGYRDCHAKFLVADDRALVSSANLETSALRDTQRRKATGESGVVVSERAEVERLVRFFTRLWYASTFEMPPGPDHTIRQRTRQASPCLVPVPDLVPAPGVIWSHTDEWIIRDTMHDIIGRARRRLLLATFSLNGMAENPRLLLEPLERAIRAHGVEVSLLCRGRNNIRAHRRDAAALAGLGVRIHADSLNHAKAAIADESHGALFSANFDAVHGLDSGVETGVRLDGQPALIEAVRYLRHAISQADLTYAPHPTQREMDERLGGGWRRPWPYERELRVAATDEVWRRFRVAAHSAPVLYASGKQDKIRLFAGDDQWTLSARRDDGSRMLERIPGEAGTSALELLESWLSTRENRADNSNKEQRGFCPAMVSRIP
ncbi:MAG TPA: phospholipase D-like domain-containing protein [Streptosporangiaceae bacterium]|nr:phospholipase D-like domain-containing protein [Streptosporangiaceae bacterium]